jgi:hypothetical protein
MALNRKVTHVNKRVNNAGEDVSDHHSVLRGEIEGQEPFGATGERESMAVDPAGEDIYRGNDLTPPALPRIPAIPDEGILMSVVCENPDDKAGGPGAEEVTIEIIKPDGDRGNIVVPLNGTTPVNILDSIRFSNDMYVSKIAAGEVALGNIKLYETSDGTFTKVHNMIGAGGNQSLVPHRMIPKGYIFTGEFWHAEEAQNRRVTFRIRSTDKNGVRMPGIFLFKDVAYLKQSTSGPQKLFFKAPELSIIKISGWATLTSGAEASCSWGGYIKKIDS